MYQVYSKIFIVYSWKYLRKARENICCVNLPRWRRWMCCWCGRRRWDAGWRRLLIGRPAAGSGSDWSAGRHVTPSCPPIGPRPQVAAPPAVARGKLLGSTFSWWWRCRVSAEYWFLPWSKLRPTSPSSLPPSLQPPPNLRPQLQAAAHIPVCIQAAELSRLPPDIWPLRHQNTVSIVSMRCGVGRDGAFCDVCSRPLCRHAAPCWAHCHTTQTLPCGIFNIYLL